MLDLYQLQAEADTIERQEAEAERQLVFALFEASELLGVDETLAIVQRQSRIEGWEHLRFRWYQLCKAIGERMERIEWRIKPFDEF